MAEPNLQSATAMLARDISFAVDTNEQAGFRVDEFEVDSKIDTRQESSLGNEAAAYLAGDLDRRLPFSEVVFFSEESSSIDVSELVSVDEIRNAHLEVPEKIVYVVKGTIEVFRTTMIVSVSVRRDGSPFELLHASRKAFREEPPQQKKLAINNPQRAAENAHQTPNPVETREPPAEKPELQSVRIDGQNAIEAFAGIGGTVGFMVETGWVSGSYLWRLNTEFPLFLGGWLGGGYSYNGGYPVGGIKLVVGDKRNGLAGSLNLGYVPSIGIYYRNIALNFMFFGDAVGIVETGYSFDID